MRLVMDTLFCDEVNFALSIAEYAPCRVAPSMEDILRASMAAVGLELIDYGSFTATTFMPAERGGVIDGSQVTVQFNVYSRAYRQRAEREAAPR